MATKNQTLVRLGKNLRKAREKRGWSQEGFAVGCGVRRSHLGSVGQGPKGIMIQAVRKSPAALEIAFGEAIRDSLPPLTHVGELADSRPDSRHAYRIGP